MPAPFSVSVAVSWTSEGRIPEAPELLNYACLLTCIYLGMFLQKTNEIVLSLRYRTCNTQPLNLWSVSAFLTSIGACIKRSSLLCFANPFGIITMHRCHHTCKTWGANSDIAEDSRRTSCELVNIYRPFKWLLSLRLRHTYHHSALESSSVFFCVTWLVRIITCFVFHAVVHAWF